MPSTTMRSGNKGRVHSVSGELLLQPMCFILRNIYLEEWVFPKLMFAETQWEREWGALGFLRGGS